MFFKTVLYCFGYDDRVWLEAVVAHELLEGNFVASEVVVEYKTLKQVRPLET